MRQYKDVNWDIFPILWIEMLKILYQRSELLQFTRFSWVNLEILENLLV